MPIIKIILIPFALLYGVITSIRNFLYNQNIFKTTSFKNVFTISVGNLSVGGTGKTPHVEYLVKLLEGRNKAILSRGFGRKTNGVILADDKSSPTQIGDEPYQYYSKFKNEVTVCVAEKRVEGANHILQSNPSVNTIILDDAFQHRAIDRNLNIMLSDYQNLFFNDYMLPFGRLREFRFGADRADAIIITKCTSELSKNEEEKIKLSVREYSKAPVFFSRFKYAELDKTIKSCYLLTGIANPQSLIVHLEVENVDVVKHHNFSDHYNYKQSDIDKIKSDLPIITTEKDYVKLKNLNLTGKTIIKIPIEVDFFGKEFDKFVLSEIDRFEKK